MEFSYPCYVPYSYQYPDLGMIVELDSRESSTNPPPRQNQWIYLVGALATLAHL